MMFTLLIQHPSSSAAVYCQTIACSLSAISRIFALSRLWRDPTTNKWTTANIAPEITAAR